MNLKKHDELLLRDLKYQPLWLLFVYIGLGLFSFLLGLGADHSTAKWLCGGDGFLVALGAEKLVTRRIRRVARMGRHRPSDLVAYSVDLFLNGVTL